MTPMIQVEGLSKRFGAIVAVADVSLSAEAGTVVGLLGPNGAGKTTVVNCLSTLVRPDAGKLTVAGFDVVGQAADVRASIALTGQYAALDEALTGRENLVLFGRLQGLGKAEAQTRAGELIERFDIGASADRPVRVASGGERRRLDVAVSQVVERPVLFLDEPTTGLDPRSRRTVWDEVRRLRDNGVAILLTTQYLDEADQLADRILIVDSGQVIAEGTPAELKAKLGASVCEVRVAEPSARAVAKTALAAAGLPVTGADDLLTLPGAGMGTLGAVVRCLDTTGIQDAEINLRHPTLDEVFLTLTGNGSVAAEHPAAVTA